MGTSRKRLITCISCFQVTSCSWALYHPFDPFSQLQSATKRACEWAWCRCRFPAQVSNVDSLVILIARVVGGRRVSHSCPTVPDTDLGGRSGSGVPPAELKLTALSCAIAAAVDLQSISRFPVRMLQSRPNSRTDNQVLRRATRSAHSYPGNRAAHCTLGLLAPPKGRAYVRRLYGGGGFGGTERSWRQASRPGSAGVTSDPDRGLWGGRAWDPPCSSCLGSST